MRAQSLLILLSLLCSSGCAFSNINLSLPKGAKTSLSGGDARQIVLAGAFVDERADKTRCGMQKNGHGVDTAKALCDVNPALWLSSLIAAELKKAGFTVLRTDDSSRASALRLDGALLTLFVEPVIGFSTLTLETDLHVKVVATSATGLQAERMFFVKGNASGLASTGENFQTSIEDATEMIAREIVAAVISLMNRYPQLGWQHGPATIVARCAPDRSEG